VLGQLLVCEPTDVSFRSGPADCHHTLQSAHPASSAMALQHRQVLAHVERGAASSRPLQEGDPSLSTHWVLPPLTHSLGDFLSRRSPQIDIRPGPPPPRDALRRCPSRADQLATRHCAAQGSHRGHGRHFRSDVGTPTDSRNLPVSDPRRNPFPDQESGAKPQLAGPTESQRWF